MLTNYEDNERRVKPRRVKASLDHQRYCYKYEDMSCTASGCTISGDCILGVPHLVTIFL
jgi:hypothetical protein